MIFMPISSEILRFECIVSVCTYRGAIYMPDRSSHIFVLCLGLIKSDFETEINVFNMEIYRPMPVARAQRPRLLALKAMTPPLNSKIHLPKRLGNGVGGRFAPAQERR